MGAKVSIIIPAYNEQKVIERCINAALKQTVAAHEIIVVDNNSVDSTRDIVRKLQVENSNAPLILVEQTRFQGLIATRNYGFCVATGNILGRIDSDSVIESNWVESLAQAFSVPRVMAVTGPVFYYDMPIRNLGFKADNTVRKMLLKFSKDNYPFLFGSNMAIRRSAWQKISAEVCLDEADKFHEDIDLSIHLTHQNLDIVYLPELVTGMSARRLESKFPDYHDYVKRFERTYSAHDIKQTRLKLPEYIYMSIYFPAKFLRSMYRINDKRSYKPIKHKSKPV